MSCLFFVGVINRVYIIVRVQCVYSFNFIQIGIYEIFSGKKCTLGKQNESIADTNTVS